MAINQFIPRGAPEGGQPPDADPFYGPLLAQLFLDDFGNEHANSALGTRWRISDSGFCSRSVAYSIIARESELDKPKPDVSSLWRMNLGTAVHRFMQSAASDHADLFGKQLEVENVVDLRRRLSGSGRSDLFVVTLDGRKVVVSLKTVNGYKFKMRATGFNGPPEGPETAHLLQLAIEVFGQEADEGVLVYFSLENMAPGTGDTHGLAEFQRFTQEWTFSKDVLVPLADAELRRVEDILTTIDKGLLPKRVIPALPAGAEITDPFARKDKGAWSVIVDGRVLDNGLTWHCAYCDWRQRCPTDGGGVVHQSEEILELRKKATG